MVVALRHCAAALVPILAPAAQLTTVDAAPNKHGIKAGGLSHQQESFEQVDSRDVESRNHICSTVFDTRPAAALPWAANSAIMPFIMALVVCCY